MTEKTLCIVGLGLIGGSIALSLKARGSAWRIRATDRRRGSLDYAVRRGLVDEVAGDAPEAVRGADVVLLATPVGDIRRLVQSLASHLEPGQVVTDVGSTKLSIVSLAEEIFPERVGFVGGHPIAGTERSGVESAVEGLFQGRVCVLTPTDSTPRAAVETVTALWTGLGAEVIYLTAAGHDSILARMSHLPNLVAFALLGALSSGVSARDLRLAGGALRDVTRVAQSPPRMWRDICLENRDEILKALDQFEDYLSRLRQAVASGDAGSIDDLLMGAGEARARLWPA